MGEHVIDFTPDGTVAAMHKDDFSLGFLGDQTINRASDILFNTATQTWGIALNIGYEKYMKPTYPWDGFATYEEARTFEVAALNACRFEQIDPTSKQGAALATTLR